MGTFASKVAGPTRVSMWTYPKDKLGLNWKLEDLYERVATAKQLGYDVQLRADPVAGLQVLYVTERPG